MTTVVIAPDGFKGSIAAADAASALADGWRSVQPDADIVVRPMADGGEGTLAAFAAAVPGARRMPVRVSGPAGDVVDAAWLLLPDATGVVELASTSGIELLGDRRLPWDADTTGFGQAIAAALDAGARRLVLGIGSSASTDGGVGMLSALGARFVDAAGAAVARGARGLVRLAAVDLVGLRPLPPEGVVVLSDVTHPLLGPSGAAAVFGPQKGFAHDELAAADAGLVRLADVLGTVHRGVDLVVPGSADLAAPGPADLAAPGSAALAVPGSATPGAGAAGGTGFGLLAWGARLVPGSAEVAELIGLPDALARADVVITGEGSFDGQSAAGKAPARVTELAASAGVPALLVAGRIAPDADLGGFAAALSLTELAGSPASALADPARWLRAAGVALARR
ncbi:glycerate kinase [Microbacterium fluvii]|uniref:Glycerate kinase n=1 Tax=Microbacterium fluvii TaxID=415215 RepID=A0ABW2HDG2_9MICO|nr:glycerate kinase [Microbacterium fluvii]MCU4673015.1 glycerate kinase [Microbacterium fluvii]